MIKTLVCHKCTQTSAHRQATTYHPTEQRAKKFHFINCFLQIQNVITYFPGTFDIFTLWLGIWSYPEVNCLAGHRLHWKALVERQTWPSAGCRGEGAAQLGVRFCYQNLARDEEEIMSWAAAPSSHFQRLRKGSGTEESSSLPQPGLAPTEARRGFWALPFPGFWPCCVSGSLFEHQTQLRWADSLIHKDAVLQHWCLQETSQQGSAARSCHPHPEDLPALSGGAVILLMNNLLLMNKPWVTQWLRAPWVPSVGLALCWCQLSVLCTHTHVGKWLVHLLSFRAH